MIRSVTVGNDAASAPEHAGGALRRSAFRGHALRAVLARTTKTGRIDRALQRLAAAKAISMEANTPVDGRIIRLTDEGRRSALGGVDPAAAWARP